MLAGCQPGAGFLKARDLGDVIKFHIFHIEPEDSRYFWAVIAEDMVIIAA